MRDQQVHRELPVEELAIDLSLYNAADGGMRIEEEHLEYDAPAGFEALRAWQKSRVLVKAINELADATSFAGPRSFRDQIQRAAVSVMSNIAEGYERGGRNEFFHMLGISKASCAEVRSLLYVALDAGYISQSAFDRLQSQAIECSRMIGALRKSVGQQHNPAR